MNLKKKVFGFVAAAALTLSMATGVAAQTPGHAVLSGTQCATGPVVGPAPGATADFGTWVYDGVSGYVPQGDTSHPILVNVTNVPAPGKTCAVTIAITQPLTNNIEEIPASHFSISVGGVGQHPVPSTFQQGTGGSVTYLLTLNSVPSEASTGTYNGTVTLTVSNGS